MRTVGAREVIVSAGALQSPALLLRWRFGPARELAALGIEVVANQPGVGKHMMEHPGVNFGCYLKRRRALAERSLRAANVRRPALVVRFRRIVRPATCT